MRILLDECVHRRLRKALATHSVQAVQEAGWRGVKNGKLMKQTATQFDAFITPDKNLEYQQHVGSLPIPVITIATPGNMWVDIEPLIPRIEEILSQPLTKKFYRVK